MGRSAGACGCRAPIYVLFGGGSFKRPSRPCPLSLATLSHASVFCRRSRVSTTGRANLNFCVPFKLFWKMPHTVEHVPLRVLAYPQRLSPSWGRGGLRSRQRSGPTLRRARAVESATRASRRTWNAVEIALGRLVLAAWELGSPSRLPSGAFVSPSRSSSGALRPRLWPCLLCWSTRMFFMVHPEDLCCPHLFSSWCRVGHKKTNKIGLSLNLAHHWNFHA